MSENPYHSPEHFGGRPRHKRGARVWLAVLGAIAAVGLLIALLLPFLGSARSAARLNACTRNLKQIALALHNYEAAYHALPPAYTVDANGKPLHSWRTLILPFLDERPLYDEIDLSKPWDDPVNVGAWNISIGAYNCPALQARKRGRESFNFDRVFSLHPFSRQVK